MLSEHRHNLIKLRDTTGASITWCKEAYDSCGYDFAKAQEIVIQRIKKEGTTSGYIKHRSNSPKFGRVGADVTISGTTGVIISLSCFTNEGAKSEIFNDTLDMLILIALSERPRNISELLGTNLNTIKQSYKGLNLDTVDNVEELLRYASLQMKETVTIEYYKILHQDMGSEFILLYPYNHHNGQVASICTFLIPTETQSKDIEWLKKRIAASVACYNPLCVHEYTIPKSVLDYVRGKEEEELKLSMPPVEGDEKAVDHITRWKLDNFLSNVVLDRIRIPSIPFQENNKPIGEVEIPIESIEKVCKDNNLVIIDFERFQTEIQGLII